MGVRLSATTARQTANIQSETARANTERQIQANLEKEAQLLAQKRVAVLVALLQRANTLKTACNVKLVLQDNFVTHTEPNDNGLSYTVDPTPYMWGRICRLKTLREEADLSDVLTIDSLAVLSTSVQAMLHLMNTAVSNCDSVFNQAKASGEANKFIHVEELNIMKQTLDAAKSLLDASTQQLLVELQQMTGQAASTPRRSD